MWRMEWESGGGILCDPGAGVGAVLCESLGDFPSDKELRELCDSISRISPLMSGHRR